jgi:uncharacterized protein YbjT (DUF2867 family)
MTRPDVIAITGATGFLGPFVARALSARFPHARLRAVVRPTSDLSRITTPGVTTAVADLRDPPALEGAFAGADTLVNLASLGFDWVEPIVLAARKAGVRRAVFIGTTAMLTTLPVASKTVRERGERLVMESGLAWTILRPTMIYGTPGDRNLVRLIRFVDRSPVVPVVAPQARQQPVHVEDVAEAVAAALAAPVTVGRAYNLSGRDPIRLVALVRDVAAALGRRRLVFPVPLALVVQVVGVWNRLGGAPVTVEQIRRAAEHKDFDRAEATRDFGFAPRSFQDGIRSAVRLWRER